MAFLKPFGGTLRDTLFEFVIIVIGVMVALGADSWRQEREEQERLRDHLTAIVGEIDQNLFSVNIIRNEVIPVKQEQLEAVLALLHTAGPEDLDSHAFLRTLSGSARSAKPWFSHSRYDAVLSADGFRHLADPQLEAVIASLYSAPGALFSQVDQSRGDYAVKVSRLVPASMVRDLNYMRDYVSPDELAPVVADPLTPAGALPAVFQQRQELAALARNEVNYATGTWYALARIQVTCEFVRKRILAHPLMQGVVIKRPFE
jgi:hypothetical protein